MNSTALITMLGFVLGWAVLAVAALGTGRLATFAFLILSVIALFLYGIDGARRPVRFWTNVAMRAVSLAACLAFGVMLARRTGFL